MTSNPTHLIVEHAIANVSYPAYANPANALVPAIKHSVHPIVLILRSITHTVAVAINLVLLGKSAPLVFVVTIAELD